MQLQSWKKFVTCLLVAAVALLTLVTAAVGQEKKSLTVDLSEIRKELGDLQGRISDTSAALDAVKKAAKSGSDLRTPHATFNRQFKQLESQIETLRSQATQMRAHAQDH